MGKLERQDEIYKNINSEALRAKSILKEVEDKKKMEREREKENYLREKKLEEERKIEKILAQVNTISLDNLSNNVNGIKEYNPYLVTFGTLLDRLGQNSELDSSEESLKIKIDLVEQINSMKKLPARDKVCHIESIKKSTRFRYLIMNKIFRKKKYRIVLHNREKIHNQFCSSHITSGIFFWGFLLVCQILSIIFGVEEPSELFLLHNLFITLLQNTILMFIFF